MVEKFIESYVKKIVKYPEQIQVKVMQDTSSDNELSKEIKILAHNSDLGRLIGKEGKMISSLKAIISGAKAKDGSIYKIVVEQI